MNKLGKINIALFCLVIIFFVIVTYLKYSKKRQPTREEAYRKGFGYYTADQSLGCVNSTSRCGQVGTETIVQYCIPNPQSGRGCIDLNGNETYNMVIKQNPCEIQCYSNKFISEDGVQVKDLQPGQYIRAPPGISGSGCNKVIDDKFGIDYTDYFLGDYNETTNNYPLKSCIPDQFAGYYQKILTCVNHDGKGDNNCRYTCGSEAGLLTLRGLYNQKLSKDLLNYFPTQEDIFGQKRAVCRDITEVDQIEILNYTQNVPSDFVYPNLCYKHLPVYDTNEDLWPNQDASNLQLLNSASYQSASDYLTVDNTFLKIING